MRRPAEEGVVGTGVGVGVDICVGVGVGTDVSVGEGEGIGVCVGEGVAVAVGFRVAVGGGPVGDASNGFSDVGSIVDAATAGLADAGGSLEGAVPTRTPLVGARSGDDVEVALGVWATWGEGS
jgi:hypothetical protein